MIRLIVRTTDAGAACHIGGPVETKFRTFDIELVELEQLLTKSTGYRTTEVIGAELVQEDGAGT